VSKRMIFGTVVTDEKRLKKGCDAMRKAGIAVEGPRFVSNYPMRDYKKKNAWVVKLPGWYGECAFAADGSGDMSGDNESEYYDERPIDLKTGKPLEKDERGIAYRVHPEVLAGRKQPGDDGRLGDIKLLRRLLVEYTGAGLAEEVVRDGGRITYQNFNQETGMMELTASYPDSL
jgi:hypothetical protein